jgi:hypothetical protein
MEESNLYTARVQVVEAMEQGLPWHEATKRAGHETQSSNSLSAAAADAPRRKAGVAGRQAWTPSQTARRGPRVVERDLPTGSSHAEPPDPGATGRAVCPPH